MTSGIYGIFSKDLECLYVGQSSNIENRWSSHKKRLRSGSHPREDFVQWLSEDHENSIENLEFKILEEASSETERNILEIKWFTLLSPKFFGKRPSEKEKWEHSDKTREKIRESVINFHRNSGSILNKNCLECSSSFETSKYKKEEFCSIECKTLSTPKISVEGYTAFCTNCGEKYNKTYYIKFEVHFCSKKCQSLYKTLDIDVEYVSIMYSEGNSLTEIADILGVSRQTIWNRLRKAGVQRRTREEAVSLRKQKDINIGAE